VIDIKSLKTYSNLTSSEVQGQLVFKVILKTFKHALPNFQIAIKCAALTFLNQLPTFTVSNSLQPVFLKL